MPDGKGCKTHAVILLHSWEAESTDNTTSMIRTSNCQLMSQHHIQEARYSVGGSERTDTTAQDVRCAGMISSHDLLQLLEQYAAEKFDRTMRLFRSLWSPLLLNYDK